jgi:GH24 family phage-related lysozyme (muramidase)
MRLFTYVIACATVTAAAGCTSIQSRPVPASPTAPAPVTTIPPATNTIPAPVSPPPLTAPALRIVPPFDGLRTLDVVMEKIREEEELRLQSYQGPSGKWLIGYGHLNDVQPGMSISQAQAEELLRQDVGVVEEVIKSTVSVPINAAEFSAMVGFAYNIGTGNFRVSTVLRKLNEGDREGAADAFLLWTKARQNGELVDSPRLVQRRSEDRELFLSK